MTDPTEEALRWVAMRLWTEAVLEAASVGAIPCQVLETEPSTTVQEARTVTRGRAATAATAPA